MKRGGFGHHVIRGQNEPSASGSSLDKRWAAAATAGPESRRVGSRDNPRFGADLFQLLAREKSVIVIRNDVGFANILGSETRLIVSCKVESGPISSNSASGGRQTLMA